MSYWKVKIAASIALVLVVSVISVSSVLADGPNTTDKPYPQYESDITPNDTYQQEAPPHPDVSPAVDTTPNPDHAILAAQTGLPRALIDEVMAQQESFDIYARRIMEMYPNEISGVWHDSPLMDKGPNTRGNIRFKGEIPTGVRSTDNVRLMSGGGLSNDEHNLRKMELSNALHNLGHRNYLIYYDESTNKIHIMIYVPTDGAVIEPRKADLLTGFNRHLMDLPKSHGAAATLLTSNDIELEVFRTDAPIMTRHHSRGGNALSESGGTLCTSGWSVSGSHGTGIITAGHCKSMKKFHQPGVTPYGMSLVRYTERSSW